MFVSATRLSLPAFLSFLFLPPSSRPLLPSLPPYPLSLSLTLKSGGGTILLLFPSLSRFALLYGADAEAPS